MGLVPLSGPVSVPLMVWPSVATVRLYVTGSSVRPAVGCRHGGLFKVTGTVTPLWTEPDMTHWE